MVLGKDFIWLHFGKCAGTTTRFLFREASYLCDFMDADHDPRKHQRIEQIKKRFPSVQIKDKKIIIGFRKLIPWIYSHNNHMLSERKISFYDFKTKSKEGLIWHSGLNNWTNPDTALIRYSQNNSFDNFIRTENVWQDFIDVFSNFGLQEKDKVKISKMSEVSLNKKTYQRDQISEDNKKKIYEQNPFWGSIEMEIYND
jgi:hypothetical protein